jgi:hypothetical protein
MSMQYPSTLIRAAAMAIALCGILSSADAQRSRGGGAGGGRASAGTSHRAASGSHHTRTASRSGGTHTAAGRSANVNRASVNNVNVNRNVNVNGAGYGRGYAGGYHPVARAATVGAMAVTTGAVIGSAYHSLPSSCATVVRPAGTYHHCGSAWYQSHNGEYIVVHEP